MWANGTRLPIRYKLSSRRSTNSLLMSLPAFSVYDPAKLRRDEVGLSKPLASSHEPSSRTDSMGQPASGNWHRQSSFTPPAVEKTPLGRTFPQLADERRVQPLKRLVFRKSLRNFPFGSYLAASWRKSASFSYLDRSSTGARV